MEKSAAQLTTVEQLWTWFDANKKQVFVGAIICVAAAVGVSFYLWNQDAQETDAAEDLSKVMASLSLADGSKRESAEAYLKFVADHPGSQAARRALMQAAAVLFTQAKYTESQALFERFLREYADSPFRMQALLGVAACLDAQGKTDEAVTAYDNLTKRYPTDNVMPQAKFALARIYDSQNKPKEALTLYQELSRIASGSIGQEANIRAEELKMQNPTLATAQLPTPAPKPFGGLTITQTNAP